MNKVLAWVRAEDSVSEVTATAMMILGGLLAAIGVVWLVMTYTKPAAHNILGDMSDTSEGLDPDTPPDIIEGWE
ncbi:hypothetical protein [Novibacillus thermophilus]|uniref:Uncharacterized protein n=1 Tax=Novibacillus thermophilus TaxID=1471761 RepID=A0A1U9K6M7_9BACL|nr:hypothetical protein [Novibacillus thermophilus]AQS55666.1 hypothetical protein B0W44_07575 [Novibacillus thermophilus]